HVAHEKGPYLLVAATFGTFDLRLFAVKHEAEIAGMLFLNPSREEEELETASTTVERIDRERLTHAIACRDAAKQGRLAGESDMARSCIPPANPQLSGQLNQSRAAMLRKAATWAALVSEWQNIRDSAAEVKATNSRRFHFPLLIISAGREEPFEGSDKDKKALHVAWLNWTRWQGDIARISSDSRLDRAPSSSRAFESTDPKLVIDGARTVLTAVRGKARLQAQ